jgi:2-polyprenyl-3-methyl-5-hydroxy-6-metoxy-1,4-benzoquinol methylase
VIASLERSWQTVADIGVGTGYFAFPIALKAAKVIAIDIDQRFLDYINHKKQTQKSGGNIETRLTTPDSPGLKGGEADLVLIVDTIHHIENRTEYLRKLKRGLRDGALLSSISETRDAGGSACGTPAERGRGEKRPGSSRLQSRTD